MTSVKDMLALYKEERELIAGGPLDDFPSWSIWRTQYLKDYEMLHVHSTDNSDIDVLNLDDYSDEDDDDDAVESRPQATTPVQPKVQPKVVKRNLSQPSTQSLVKKSKKQLATDAYRKMMVDDTHPSRADVINVYVTELGMSKAGASTYHNSIKQSIPTT